MKAVFHTEDINSYGFWIEMSGMNLDRYKKNPILLYDHNGWDMSVGKVNNLRIENNQLVGDVEFDIEDKMGKKLARKYKKGYMSGFSIGVKPIEWSEDAQKLKKGQTRSTVTKSELFEISAVNLPSNENALKLYTDNDNVKLSGNVDETLLNSVVPKIELKSKKQFKMKEIALALGLQEDATDEQIKAKIAELKAEADKVVILKDKNKVLVLNYGRAKGVITDDNQKLYSKSADSDVELAISLIDEAAKNVSPSGTQKLSDKITPGQNPTPKVEAKNWDELSEKELIHLRERDKVQYVKLFSKKYGYEPTI